MSFRLGDSRDEAPAPIGQKAQQAVKARKPPPCIAHIDQAGSLLGLRSAVLSDVLLGEQRKAYIQFEFFRHPLQTFGLAEVRNYLSETASGRASFR
jgi:hypothetical protein